MPGEVAIIPRPQAVWVDEHGSRFALAAQTPVLAEAGNAGARDAAVFLVDLLTHAYPERPAPVEHAGRETPAGAILLTARDADPALGDEGYELLIATGDIVVRAMGARGFLHGVQSLRQLLPPEIESSSSPASIDWSLPSVRIVDRPRFPWRGLMLDTSRFFLPFEYLLRVIDLLALHKMSVLHLHLSDDQGWRIESERHPELHMFGSNFDAELAPEERGSYYTRAELRQIVAHASRRGIEIVPEVDVPGHSLAILRAHPDLACRASPEIVRQRDEFRLTPWFDGPLIHDEVLCACNERAYDWLADVLDELTEIFPGPWVHLGGDETPITAWQTSY